MTEPTPAARSIPTDRRPELGLALSGGGFRAAFFHLGVLARLAELGLLRHVEVISTVSGGSIVGALYYLHVKDLLENVADEEVRDEHYVRIVEHMERTFYAGVARHVRALTYANLRKNIRMRRADYSRSDRIGELYDEIFYRPAWDNPLFGAQPAPRQGEYIQLRDLPIRPVGGQADNERRRARVPVLLVNATSLNTGHNWRFQAEAMGEDPRTSDAWVAIDKNMRLRSARYDDIAPHQRNFELGLAVAASACVPAIFHPLAVSGLFRRDGTDIRVELVDGGVHDNQGVCGLIDSNCRRMILSDASGQMSDMEEPVTRIPGVGGRSMNIYGDRVREEQLIGALNRDAVALMHLRKGRPARVLAPIGAGGEPLAQPVEHGETSYGIDQTIQDPLSRVRTDLDSFTEVEAYSLALFGHAMASEELELRAIRDLGRADPVEHQWQVEGIAELRARMRDGDERLRAQLTVANKLFGKSIALSRSVKVAVVAAGLVVAAALALGLYAIRGVFTADVPVLAVVAVVAIAVFLARLYFAARLKTKTARALADWLYTRASPLLLAPVFFVAAWAMLLLNPAFLRAGRIARLADPPRREVPAGPLAQPRA